jgi:hypothetical protein
VCVRVGFIVSEERMKYGQIASHNKFTMSVKKVKKGWLYKIEKEHKGGEEKMWPNSISL